MRLSVTMDNTSLLRKLGRYEKRLAYAVSGAINDVAKGIQQAERANVRQRFTLRKEAFIMRNVALIKPFASPRMGRPYAVVAVGKRQRLLLGQLEEGGTKTPAKGKSVAVPVLGGPARPSFPQPVADDLTFRAMRIRKKGRTFKGQRGTYQVDGVGVFQQQEGAQQSRLVYAFVKAPKLRPMLRFRDTATREFRATWAAAWRRRLRMEVQRAGAR